MAKTTIHSSQFIIGSVDKRTGTFSINATPVLHTDYRTAVNEALRLAGLFTEKKFVVYAISAVAEDTLPRPVPLSTVVVSYSL